jgi:MarR family transcriptional regulator, lower aerobic nicotinate degradation pathway regulator
MPDEASLPPVARTLNGVRAIVRALRINTRAIEQQAGMSLAQLFVLQSLAERPATSLNDLAARTATHQSSVSVVVRRLVDRGLVTRTTAAADKRRVEIDLTAEGRQVLAGAPVTVQQQMLHGFAQLPPAGQDRLADLMEQWLSHSGIDTTSVPMLGEEA